MGLDANEYVTVKNFQGGFYPDLLPLLNAAKGGDVVTKEMLARTVVLVFELNCSHAAANRGWERGCLVFNDSINPCIAVDWDDRTGPSAYPAEVLASGSSAAFILNNR